MKQKNKAVLWEVLFIGALILFIAYSFYAFARDNNNRILEQNNSFIETATRQTADRVDDLINDSIHNVELLAHLYGSVMTEPVVDAEMLQDMMERSTFDYVEFISADGMDLTANAGNAGEQRQVRCLSFQDHR